MRIDLMEPSYRQPAGLIDHTVIYPSIYLSILTNPNNQLIYQPTNKPTNQQTNKPTNQQTSKPTDQQTNKPTNQQTNKRKTARLLQKKK